VLATTSIGQEGLDFHLYCRKVMHWNLPTNPIDIEQREGRVNRFKGLVIRQNIVDKYSSFLNGQSGNLWDNLFQIAREKEGENKKKSELVPFWHVESESIKIERIIPLLPYSREVKQLKKMLEVLTLHRLTFGQPRQEELVETLYSYLSKEEIVNFRKSLMIDLSPINYFKKNQTIKPHQNEPT
jgi:superfamily II DNA/RNA helicase